MADYVTFKSFYTQEEALELSKLFTDNSIGNRIEKVTPFIDKVIAGDSLPKEFHLQIKQHDFIRANNLLDELITKNISAIDKDYYLHSFSNDELLEVINKPDEWNNQDVIIARKLLTERGIDITEHKLNEIKLNRIYQLAEPEKVPSYRIIRGYLYAIFVPVIGIFVGLAYLNTKTVLPDGNKVVAFDESTRQHGKNIFVISCCIIAILAVEVLYLSFT